MRSFSELSNLTEQISLPGIALDPWPDVQEVVTRAGFAVTIERVLVDTPPKLEAMREELLSKAETIAYDTETSGLKRDLGARIVGHAVCYRSAPYVFRSFYVPVRHIGGHNESQPQVDPSAAAAVVREVLGAAKCVGYHHAKFDWLMARADGIEPPATYVDTSILAIVNDENERSFSLKALGARYAFDLARMDEKELHEWMKRDARALKMPYKKAARGTVDDAADNPQDAATSGHYLGRFGFARSPIRLCGKYACLDVVLTLFLWQMKFARVWQQFPEVTAREHAIQRLLFEMEWHGLWTDAHTSIGRPSNIK